MLRSPMLPVVTGLMTLVLALPPATLAAAARRQPSGTPALRIVVIAGEDAVNVIQQKTAVAPIVEVRDRNDQPVAGVVVRFVVRGGKGATLNGQTALTITTDAAGRAAVPAFSPTAAGPLQIDVSATFGKETFSTTIRQQTFRTAADAAKAGQSSSSSSSGSASGGAAAGGGAATGTASAAGGGGGMSGTTIGLIAVGAGAGIFVAAKAAGGGGDSGGGSSGAGGSGGGSGGGGSGGGGSGGGGTTQNLTVSGPFTQQIPISWTYSNGLGTCTWPWTRSGTLRMALQVQPSGAVTGTATVTAATSTGTITCSFFGGGLPGSGGSAGPPGESNSTVSGTTGNVTFSETVSSSDQGTGFSWTMAFTGTLASGVVTGTLRENYTWSNIPGVTVYGGAGSTTVTLR